MPPAPLTETWTEALVRGFRVRPTILFLIAAMNTAIALLVWVEDPRPFWHPFVSVQLSGFAVAYCVNVAAPWNKRHPIPRLALAVAVGSLLIQIGGVGLIVVVVLVFRMIGRPGYARRHIRLPAFALILTVLLRESSSGKWEHAL